MGMIAPLDSAFLIQEAREHPMHVAGLQIFKPPPDKDEDYPGDLYRELLWVRTAGSRFEFRAVPGEAFTRAGWPASSAETSATSRLSRGQSAGT